MSGDKISFGNVKGDVIGANVSGLGNIIGKKISINKKHSQKMPEELADSLQSFSESVSKLLEKNSIPNIEVENVQRHLDELSEEASAIEPDKEVPYVKKSKIKAKIAGLADNLLRLLPSTAETAAAFTPLAPFSKVIGESVEEIIRAVRG